MNEAQTLDENYLTPNLFQVGLSRTRAWIWNSRGRVPPWRMSRSVVRACQHKSVQFIHPALKPCFSTIRNSSQSTKTMVDPGKGANNLEACDSLPHSSGRDQPSENQSALLHFLDPRLNWVFGLNSHFSVAELHCLPPSELDASLLTCHLLSLPSAWGADGTHRKMDLEWNIVGVCRLKRRSCVTHFCGVSLHANSKC